MSWNVCLRYVRSNFPLKVIRQSLNGVAILCNWLGLNWLSIVRSEEERR